MLYDISVIARKFFSSTYLILLKCYRLPLGTGSCSISAWHVPVTGVEFGFGAGLEIVLLALLLIDLDPYLFGLGLGLGLVCLPAVSPGNTQFVEKHSWLLVHLSPLFLLPKRKTDLGVPFPLFWVCLLFGAGFGGFLFGGLICLFGLFRFDFDPEFAFLEFGRGLDFGKGLAIVLVICWPIYIYSIWIPNLKGILDLPIKFLWYKSIYLWVPNLDLILVKRTC